MEMGFDHRNWPQDRAAARPESGEVPDWAGLRARFLAAEALRRAAQDGGLNSAALPVHGSFDDAAAQNIATYANGECAVNRTDSTDGKAPAGIDRIQAGNPPSGNRG